ncbi:MAG: hypothetical protein RJA36_1433 [Pseudomonadota bacterium]|jgi:hypothetical protein
MAQINVHELHNSLDYAVGLAPVAAAQTDNTALVSAIIDSQDLETFEFVIMTGTLADADATFAVTMDHGDAANLSDAAAAPTECLIGTLAAAGFTFAADSAIRKIGVVPRKGAGKRYWRLTVTPSNNTGAAPIVILVVKKGWNVPFTPVG